jgi:succinate dehydrogenase / fumarate reductase cytochrome b subunit
MALSILHRVTGVAMAAGLLVYAAWLMAAAGDGAAYGTLTDLLASLPGQLLLVGWTAAFFLHLANGIRHLVWDTGRGFGKAQATSSGWFVVVVTVVLTLVYWVLV